MKGRVPDFPKGTRVRDRDTGEIGVVTETVIPQAQGSWQQINYHVRFPERWPLQDDKRVYVFWADFDPAEFELERVHPLEDLAAEAP